MGPAVSIVVPVHNAAPYIRETMISVFGQSFRDWELILVDDGSSDASAAIIKETAKEADIPLYTLPFYERNKDPWELRDSEKGTGEIVLLRLRESRGAAGARNVGVRAAAGRFLAFLDADDLWLPEKLFLETVFLKDNNAAFAFTAYEFGNENAERTGKIVHVPKTLDYSHALTRTIIFTSTVMFDLKKISREEIYMEKIASEDTATWWRILKKGTTAYGLDSVLTIYRRPVRSLSSDKRVAVKRIWNLYRRVAGLSRLKSIRCMIGWAVRATLRRL
ncbi:MAG: glycosyltransferase family 2 protein [Lachnospiraceae bacterium]|nr:glycosyltransferase family 2 protein [Lachnospiraceae bacterium]